MNNGVNETADQRTTRTAKIAWLAGIIDGEGSIFAYRGGQWGSLRITVAIQATSRQMIEKTVAIYNEFGIKHKTPKVRFPEGKRPVYSVIVTAFPAIYGLCELLLPFLAVKTDEFLTVKHFLERHVYFSRNRAPGDVLIQELKRLKRICGGESLLDEQTTPNQASRGLEEPWLFDVREEGVTARNLTPENNGSQERPASSPEDGDIA